MEDARAMVHGLVANGKVRDVRPKDMHVYVCQQQAGIAEASTASALASSPTRGGPRPQ